MQYVGKRFSMFGIDTVCWKEIQYVSRRCGMMERDSVCQEELQYVHKRFGRKSVYRKEIQYMSGVDAVYCKEIQYVRKKCSILERDSICQE